MKRFKVLCICTSDMQGWYNEYSNVTASFLQSVICIYAQTYIPGDSSTTCIKCSNFKCTHIIVYFSIKESVTFQSDI